MKRGALLLALALALALGGIAWLRSWLARRDAPATRRRIETRFKRVEMTRPLDPGHYYRRYWR